MICIVGESFAQDGHRNVDASIEFHNGIVRPENLTDLLASNDVTLALQQDSQNLEGLLAEQDLGRPICARPAADRGKLPGSDVELKASKSD
jgi:hypothetical protein